MKNSKLLLRKLFLTLLGVIVLIMILKLSFEIETITYQSIALISRNIVIIIFSLFIFHELSSLLFRSIGSWIFLLISIIVFIVTIVSVKISIEAYGIDMNKYSVFVFKQILVASTEELLFRFYTFVILFAYFKESWSLRRTVWVSSFLFAIIHLVNMFNPGMVKLSVLVQVIFAFGIGVLFQSILLRTRSLLLVVSLHFAVNMFGSYRSYFEDFRKPMQITEDIYTYSDFFGSLILVGILVFLIMIPLSLKIMPNSIKIEQKIQ